MPTYVYRREDGSTFEIEQRITEDPLERCPDTGQKVERVITGSAGLIFKGSGFYLTDYARSNGNGESKTSETKATSEDASATEGKSEPKKSASEASSGSD